MQMSDIKRRLSIGMAFTLCCARAVCAGTWQGGSSESPGNDFGNGANWNPSGVPTGDITFENTAGSKTVVFTNAFEFSGKLHVYDGTAQDPVVFKASGDSGLNATANEAL